MRREYQKRAGKYIRKTLIFIEGRERGRSAEEQARRGLDDRRNGRYPERKGIAYRRDESMLGSVRLRNSSQRLQFDKPMKNVEAKAIFQEAVIGKLKKAKELGIKASWTTEDHLRALARVLAEVPKGQGEIAGEMYELLADCYNISGFSKALGDTPSLKAAGHFQRAANGVKETKEDVYKDLL